jgi:hypothetical protein
MEPELSVVAFRRLGWVAHEYAAWSRRMLESGAAFVAPSGFQGQPILRICIVNPRTTVDDLRLVFDSLA